MGLETAAIATLAVSGAVSTAAQIYQGQQAASAQKKGLRRQEAVQTEAKQSALSQQIRAEQAQAAANRKTPDIASLLAFEQNTPPIGPSVDRSKLKLGKPSLLGDV